MKYFTRIFYLPQLWGYYLIKFYIRRSAGLDILHGPRTTDHGPRTGNMNGIGRCGLINSIPLLLIDLIQQPFAPGEGDVVCFQEFCQLVPEVGDH